MMQVPLNQVKDDLSRYLRLATKEDVIITRHGVPAGMLVGFEDPEDWWEEQLLRDPRFKARVAQARQSLREGKGITLEAFREKHGLNTVAVKTHVKAETDKARSKPMKRRATSSPRKKATRKVIQPA
jgi:prevent-host-death family protein